MKKLTFWISAVLILGFWPISFIMANRDSWIPFFFGVAILLLDFVLYQKSFKYHYFLYLIFPLIHPALLLFPFFVISLHIFSSLRGRLGGRGNPVTKSSFISLVTFVTIIFIVTIFSIKTFYAYSIFTPDPLAFDTLNQKFALIPNRNLARIFENKTTIFQDKFKSNIFISLDLNNYFFSLHPQEIGGNQNLSKFPYLAIIPFLLGLYYLLENKNKGWIINIFISSALTIAFINNQDRFDLLLYLPVALICLFGLKKMEDNLQKYFWIFSTVFFPLTLVEFARLFIK